MTFEDTLVSQVWETYHITIGNTVHHVLDNQRLLVLDVVPRDGKAWLLCRKSVPNIDLLIWVMPFEVKSTDVETSST